MEQTSVMRGARRVNKASLHLAGLQLGAHLHDIRFATAKPKSSMGGRTRGWEEEAVEGVYQTKRLVRGGV